VKRDPHVVGPVGGPDPPARNSYSQNQEYHILMSGVQAPKVVRRVWAAGRVTGLLLAAFAGLSGCGQSDSLPKLQVYEVKGKVLLPDGKPLSSGFISFVPKGDLPLTPSAEIGSDGTFSLVTGGSGEGAPAGDYKVRIETPQLGAAPKAKKPLFPSKYTDEDSSQIVVTVRPQENHLDPIVLR
jgi:hypothetical protein